MNGLKNNTTIKKKERNLPSDKRPSILAKLRQKQKALAEKNGKAKAQENEKISLAFCRRFAIMIIEKGTSAIAVSPQNQSKK